VDRLIISNAPVRKITNRGFRKIIGNFNSKKTGRDMPFEFRLEEDALILLDYFDYVKDFNSQCVIMKYHENGVENICYPDLFVKYDFWDAIVEIKASDKVYLFENRFRLQSEICKAKGFKFEVLTENEIRIEPRLSNIKTLNRFAGVMIGQDNLTIARELLSSNKKLPLGHLEVVASEHGIELIHLYSMIYHGFLQIDLMEPLSLNSMVRLPPEERKK
jgi:hypothetical protein